jgi:agmatine/peptidylarginine deiminase
MRFVSACFAAVLAMMLIFPVTSNAASQQYVQITESFINVYERLDPKSPVIVMAKKGDRFDLIYAGPIWYQVKVKDQIGWIERKAGRVIEGNNVFSTILSIVVVCALLAGTLYFVLRVIKKQKTA